ncbi:hypothetical protein BZA77DRAFT_112288 [Pyronema omphalodes]|nr:hypothetical protein BZA77DRAFT_112288 [Pyronema omphalodes]
MDNNSRNPVLPAITITPPSATTPRNPRVKSFRNTAFQKATTTRITSNIQSPAGMHHPTETTPLLRTSLPPSIPTNISNQGLLHPPERADDQEGRERYRRIYLTGLRMRARELRLPNPVRTMRSSDEESDSLEEFCESFKSWMFFISMWIMVVVILAATGGLKPILGGGGGVTHGDGNRGQESMLKIRGEGRHPHWNLEWQKRVWE